jgi:integrase
VLAAARREDMSNALAQDIGAAMRALVAHARRLRWLTAHSEDPMWTVRYAKKATVQGAAAVYVPRSSLPTDAECAALFNALDQLGHHRWSVAMRLAHRAGLRWGELVALQAQDVEFEPARIVHVRRAVEQGARGPATVKPPKNGKARSTIFPKSVAADLRAVVGAARARGGVALLFASRSGGIVRRSAFQQVWVRAADAAGWPMTTPLRPSAGYGEKNKGWRWDWRRQVDTARIAPRGRVLDALRPRPRSRRRCRQARPRRPGLHRPSLHRPPQKSRHGRERVGRMSTTRRDAQSAGSP